MDLLPYKQKMTDAEKHTKDCMNDARFFFLLMNDERFFSGFFPSSADTLASNSLINGLIILGLVCIDQELDTQDC